jgi:hypothetical protein
LTLRLRSLAAALKWFELPLLLGLWAGLALWLSSQTTRVVDWFVMTDELLYERLAISVSQLGSPLPHVHGELIPNVNQLYPLLISRAFGHGLVPSSLHDAHALNAWVMSSACIPAYLLARRVTGRAAPAYVVAFLTVCLPWIVLSSFLLTEVAGYPAFLWAVLAIQLATSTPSKRHDVLALVGIGLAILARTQFVALLAVVPAALFARELGLGRGVRDAARRTVRSHQVLTAAYAVLAAALVVLAVLGLASRVLGTYRGALEGNLLPNGIAASFAEHASALALGLGILPFVVGLAWLLANVVRPPAKELHAFACVASVTILAVMLEVTVFDLRFGSGSVRDRYLFYVVPLVLIAFLCALLDARWPRRSLLISGGLVAIGFAVAGLPNYGGLYVDSPVATVNDYLRSSLGSLDATRAFLIAATVVLALLFVQGSLLLPHRYLATALVLLLLVGLPLETRHVFDNLFRYNGASGRPITVAQGGVFDWVDRTVGTAPDVSIAPYPVLPGEYWSSVSYWWDLEFWNRSVARAVHFPGQYEWTPSTFPKTYVTFDPDTGRASASPTRYVIQSDKETRFRIRGTTASYNRGVYLTDTVRPWRADWLSFGLYDDGWTRPGVPATVRVYPAPGQRRPVTRYVSLGFRSPAGVAERGVAVRSSLEHWRDVATGATLYHSVKVCVPPGGYGSLGIRALGRSPVYGDMRDQTGLGAYRIGGVLLVQIALADEVGPPCRPQYSG